MKFSLSRQDLANLLTRLQSVIGQKSTLPILSNILVEAKGNEVILTATDLTVGMRGICSAKVTEEGATTLPARRLTQLVKELTTPQIEIQSGSDQVTQIIANRSRFRLNGLSPEEFPALPNLSEALRCSISQEDLKCSLQRTAFTVSREGVQYVLTGVLLKVASGMATFVGTDGKRLSKAHAKIEAKDPIEGNYILPIKAVEELVRNLEDEGEATLYLLPDRVAVDSSSILVVSKLLDGEFPDYQRVIPNSSALHLELHREELTTLLRQVSLFTSDSSQPVRFTFADNELSLSANAMDIGEGKVSMPVNYQGEKLDIAFNPNYFLDILRHCDKETVSLDVTDAFNPGIIVDKESGESITTEEDLFVLMPMRIE